MAAAILSQPPDEVPADLVLRRQRGRADRRLPARFTLDGGLGSLIDDIVADPCVELRLGTPVAAVRRAAPGFVVRMVAGEELRAPLVAVATPPSVAAVLLRGDLPEAAAALAAMGVVRVDALGVVVRREAVSLPAVAGLVPVR